MPLNFQMIVWSKVEMWNWNYKPKHIYYWFKVRSFCSPQSSEHLRFKYLAHIHLRQVPCNTLGHHSMGAQHPSKASPWSQSGEVHIRTAHGWVPWPCQGSFPLRSYPPSWAYIIHPICTTELTSSSNPVMSHNTLMTFADQLQPRLLSCYSLWTLPHPHKPHHTPTNFVTPMQITLCSHDHQPIPTHGHSQALALFLFHNNNPSCILQFSDSYFPFKV